MSVDYKYYISRYIQEIIEAFIALSLFSILTSKIENEFKNILFKSFFIGALTLLLEEYDPSYKNTIKNGMLVGVGSQLVKS